MPRTAPKTEPTPKSEHVDTKISHVSEVAKQALLNLDRSERRIRRWTLVTAVAVFLVSLILILLIFTYGTRQLNQIHRQQNVLEQEGQKINQSLQILKNATDPRVQAAQHQQTEELIYCLGSLINADTGHGKLDSSCVALFVPPPQPVPASASSSSTQTTSPTHTTQGPTTTTIVKKK